MDKVDDVNYVPTVYTYENNKMKRAAKEARERGNIKTSQTERFV